MHPTESPLSTPRPADEFERCFMLAFDMCCVASLEGFFQRVNPAFVTGLGYSEAELLARCFLELVHPEDVARTRAELASLAQGDGAHAFQNRYRHRDGTYRWLEWTPDRVIQVLLNLVDNAVKFTPPGGAIRVSARDEGHAVRFEVQHEGRGIPEAMREQIFERFQQVTSSDAREKGGAGLGLAICRGLVEAHGGRLGVEGAPGQGSTFGLSLPHKPVG